MSQFAALIRTACHSSSHSLRRVPEGTALAHSLQSGRLAHEFRNPQAVGQGGFGTVLKAQSNEDDCCYGLKLIPMKLRNSETVDSTKQNWSGKKIFEQLQRCDSPYVLRYFDFWGEELASGVTFGQHAADVSDGIHVEPTQAAYVADGIHTDEISCSRVESSTYSQHSSIYSEEGLPDGFHWDSRQRAAIAECKYEADSLQCQRSPQNALDEGHEIVLVVKLEYCNGVKLSSWLQDVASRDALSRGSVDGALALFRQLLWALSSLHSKGIVHRDLKPDNLFVAPHGCIKLFDFGLAQLQSPSKPSATLEPAVQSHDAVFTAIGTPGYAPPEHCMTPTKHKINETDSSADIYSAGVILLELLLAATKGVAWSTSMERIIALEDLRGSRSRFARAILPDALQRSDVPGWLRQLVTDMVLPRACDRPRASKALEDIYAGTSAMHRHNPYVGTRLITASPAYTGLWGFAPNFPPVCVRRCPYIGFFTEHRCMAGHV